MSSSRNSKLDAIIAAYVEATERSEQPDRQQLIADHPEQAEELARFFADFDKMQATHLQIAPESDATVIPQHEPKHGTLIGGRYKLRENIGEGGMGSVWVAEQLHPVKRKVAIKLVKAGMDSKQVLARFEAERQALAVMDHSNIAKVFDGGMTENGRPYFVMEYVKGVPFTEYCDKARLSLKERLNLFIPVCQAVQHAHHKGIVHRDLKPSNILICLYDGKPVPKVIDFGLAKAMNQSLTEHSIFTGHGVMVGTPLYMSPEQAEHNNLDIDTRTDIYSLGVVLYELLTGTTPLEREQLRTAAYQEILRLIKEVEPLRPSTRLSGSASLPSVAAQRNIDPRHLQRSLAGDLDWIVMKSLEKERSRRYETATGLARDVERFLNDEAVEACPPSLGYRLRKFVRRHKPQVISASLILWAFLIGIVATTWGWRSATDAAKSVKQSLDEVTKALDSEKKALAEKSTALVAASTARDLAERQFIEGILRPIGFGDEPTPAELRSLVDWSKISDVRLRLKILDIAFENPEIALRLARRAERAMQACIGLSLSRRAKAIKLLSAKQRDMEADRRIRTAAAWLALELGSSDLPALPEALTWLSAPIAPLEPRPEFTELADLITNRVEVLDPDQFAQVVQILIGLLEKTEYRDWGAHQTAGNAIAALAEKLSPEQITRGGDALIAVLEKSWYMHSIDGAGNGLVALAPKLSPEQITRGWDAYIGIIKKNPQGDHYSLMASRNGLVALAPKLSSEQITQGVDTLIAVLELPLNGAASQAGWSGLMSLAPHLTPDQSTRVGNLLIRVLEESRNHEVVEATWSALIVLAPKLSTDQTTRAWDALINFLETWSGNIVIDLAGNCLVTLAPSGSAEQITRGWDALIAVLQNEKSTSMSARGASGIALVALATRLSADQSKRGWDVLIEVLESSTDWHTHHAAGEVLAALAPKLNAEQITHNWDALIRVLQRKKLFWAIDDSVGNGLAALAPKLGPSEIPNAGGTLIEILQQLEDPYSVPPAAKALVAMAPKLTEEQLTIGADALINLVAKTEYEYAQAAAVKSLVALRAKLGAEQMIRSANAFIGVQEKSIDPHDLDEAGNGLVALAPKLSPETRVRTAESFVATLRRSRRGHVTKQLLELMPELNAPTQERISEEVMRIQLDYCAQAEYYHETDNYSKQFDMNAFQPSVMAMSNEQSLASLLQHPAATGAPRELMLQRFEELIFHDGNRVFLTLPEADDESPSATPEQTKPEPPPRRFHTIHDAATWIQQNWRDFDLDATHPVTWRGER